MFFIISQVLIDIKIYDPCSRSMIVNITDCIMTSFFNNLASSALSILERVLYKLLLKHQQTFPPRSLKRLREEKVKAGGGIGEFC